MYEEKRIGKENIVCRLCADEARQRHDLYKNPRTGKIQPVPRHAEIDDDLAKHIIKELA